MKIMFPSTSGTYPKAYATRAEAAKGGFAAGKKDVADFTHGISSGLDKAFLGGKASIQNDVYAPTSTQKLAEIKQAVKEGSYHVPTEDIIAALLNG